MGTPIAIPYEKQSDAQGSRMCGPASLAMVYRSFGTVVPQTEIWPRISKRNNLGSLASAAYLMAQDAISRGFAALAIQARHPLQVLRLCQDKSIRAVLSHRLKEDSIAGHYTVLLEVDGEGVVLHDPFFGPSRRLSHAALLELWRPSYPQTEITGNVLIAIAAQPAAVPPCNLCGAAIPPAVSCPACDKRVVLQPAALLGCVNAECPNRMWNQVCCPSCDRIWSFSSQPSTQASTDSEIALPDLNPVFSEIDKFCSLLLGTPGVGTDPRVREQVELLAASKDQLKLAQSEVLAHRRTQTTWMTEFQQECRQDEKALLKAKEEIQKPGAPLDGDALGRALLKSLDLLP